MGETPPSATAAMAAKRAALADRRQALADQAALRRRRSWRWIAAAGLLAAALAAIDILTGRQGWSAYPIGGLLTGIGWAILRMRRNN